MKKKIPKNISRPVKEEPPASDSAAKSKADIKELLTRLKGKSESGGEPSAGDPTSEEKGAEAISVPGGTSPIDIDLYQSESDFIIYAQIPGALSKDIEVFIEKGNDIVIIRGQRKRPEVVFEEEQPMESKAKEASGRFLKQECSWGAFFRKIILPEEVNPEGAAGKFENGVLIVHLPLLKAAISQRRKIRIEDEEKRIKFF